MDTTPTYRSGPAPFPGLTQYRASYGAVIATSIARTGEKPDLWTITRLPRRVGGRARVEQMDLGTLRRGWAREGRALAGVIVAGLRGRI